MSNSGSIISQQSAIEANTQSDFYPNPISYNTGETNPFSQDSAGSLQTRSAVFTDEDSLRNSFSDSGITNLTGSVTFTNGSTTVTGSGSSFTTECDTGKYTKMSSHAASTLTRIAAVISDTEMELEEPYPGATATDTAVVTQFQFGSSGTGASISSSSSALRITSGTSNGGYSFGQKLLDYCPITVYADISISQRVANQETILGFVDVNYDQSQSNPISGAVIVFDGIDNTKIKFRTYCNTTLQETIVTIPGPYTTEDTLDYELDILEDKTVLLINGRIVVTHTDEIPKPYDVLKVYVHMKNIAAVTATTFYCAVLFASNHNVVKVSNYRGDPIRAQIIEPVYEDDRGFSDGQIATAGTGTVIVRSTIYTEQTSGAQRSIKSSSTSDTAAGTGARTIRIEYYKSNYAGPFFETVTLNGTTAAQTVATDICYIQEMRVLTAGSGGAPVGTISLYANTAGTGTVIWSISAGLNKTFGCHHYVAKGIQCLISSVNFGTSGTTAANGATFWLTSRDGLLANAVIQQISDTLNIAGVQPNTIRPYGTPIVVNGPSFIVGYAKPYAPGAYSQYLSFDFKETYKNV